VITDGCPRKEHLFFPGFHSAAVQMLEFFVSLLNMKLNQLLAVLQLIIYHTGKSDISQVLQSIST